MAVVSGISFHHFRNHRLMTVFFPELTTVIVGENACGKTSILEGLHLLATGKSFRAEKVEEMIQMGAEVGRVQGKVVVPKKEDQDLDEDNVNADDSEQLEVLLTRGIVQGKKTHATLYSVNGTRRRKKDFVGHLSTVVFRPEDMRLIEGSPSRRRHFLDEPLSTVYRQYAESLTTYEQTLLRRNKLLHAIKEGTQHAGGLQFWNLSLIKHGEIVQQFRREFVAFCNSVAFPVPLSAEYQPSVMSAERLAQYAQTEIAAGHTLIGPHKDDLIVKLQLPDEVGDTISQPQPIAAFGSRGQQRLAVLWLKLCELHFLQTKTGQQPLLLLDDILSELDIHSREIVMGLLGKGQSVISTTEQSVVEELKQRLPVVHVIMLPLEKSL